MDISVVLFYVVAITICLSALSVVLNRSPIYAALSLVVSMIFLAFIFLLLQAYFIAGVQLIVYAGAVMVLFVMVLMLFNLKDEQSVFINISFIKLSIAILSLLTFVGLLAVAFFKAQPVGNLVSVVQYPNAVAYSVKDFAQVLFGQYIFAFEILGMMLLFIAIGVSAISRAKGGSHARS